MKLLSWLIFIPFAAVVVIFATSNRALVSVDFWPLPFVQDIELYQISLGTLAFGFVVGGLISSVSTLKWRLIANSRKRDLELAEEKAARLQKRIELLEKSPAPKGAAVGVGAPALSAPKVGDAGMLPPQSAA